MPKAAAWLFNVFFDSFGTVFVFLTVGFGTVRKTKTIMRLVLQCREDNQVHPMSDQNILCLENVDFAK